MAGIRLPNLNRQRYIVLRAYTYNSLHVETVPIELGNKDCPVKRHEDFENGGVRTTFRTCFGRLSARSKSATVRMPTDLRMSSTVDGLVQHHFADGNSSCFDIKYDHTEDPSYVCKDVVTTKMLMPWRLQEKTGASFVFAKHINNRTPMIMPTGVASFKTQHSLNIFNQVPKADMAYDVPFNTEVGSLYLMSDKPLVVESIYDPVKYNELSQRSLFRPYWFSSSLKLNNMLKHKNA